MQILLALTLLAATAWGQTGLSSETSTGEEKAVGQNHIPTCPRCQCNNYIGGWWTDCVAQVGNACARPYCNLYCFDDFSKSLSGHPRQGSTDQPDLGAMGSECSAHIQRAEEDYMRRQYSRPRSRPWWETWDFNNGPHPSAPGVHWDAEAATGEEKAVGRSIPTCPRCQCSGKDGRFWVNCVAQPDNDVCYRKYCNLYCFDDFSKSLSGHPREGSTDQPDLGSMHDECIKHIQRAKEDRQAYYGTEWAARNPAPLKTWDWSKGPHPDYPGLYWDAEAVIGEEKVVGRSIPTCPRCQCSGYDGDFFTNCAPQGNNDVCHRKYCGLYCFDDFSKSLSGYLHNGIPDLPAMANECSAHMRRAEEDYERQYLNRLNQRTPGWGATWDWSNGPHPDAPGVYWDAEASKAEAAMTANAVTAGSSSSARSLAVSVLAVYGFVVVLYGAFRHFTKKDEQDSTNIEFA